jgi:D-xylose transport system permease protein
MSETLQERGETTVTTVETPQTAQRPTIFQLLRGDLGFIPVLFTLIVLVAYFSFASRFFLTPQNISNLFQQSVAIGVASLGVTLVLLLGEIDLSVIVVGTLGAGVMGVLVERIGWAPFPAIVLGLLTGMAVGALNGFFVAVLRIPSFIVTLASAIFYTGVLLALLNHQETLIVHNEFITGTFGSARFLPDVLGVGLPTLVLVLYILSLLVTYFTRKSHNLRTRSLGFLIVQIVLAAILVEGTVAILENTPGPIPGTYLGVPVNVAVFLSMIVLLWLVLTRTRFGRHIYAVGGNAEAARRAGINITFIRIAVFALCSTIAAAGGMLAAARNLGVASQVPPTLLLEAIAAAVIGGVSLFGGRGSIWSLVLGALIIGSLENGLDLLNLGSDVKQIVEGGVLIFAVAVDALVRRAQSRSSSGR